MFAMTQSQHIRYQFQVNIPELATAITLLLFDMILLLREPKRQYCVKSRYGRK